MSIAEIERFAADLKSNEALRGEAEKARTETSPATPTDRLVAFARSKGYTFTADEAKEHIKARAKADGRALTDAELDGVAGGVQGQPYKPLTISDLVDWYTDRPIEDVARDVVSTVIGGDRRS